MENEMTARMLWEYAKNHNLEDAPIRICDGMAVSYLPTRGCLCRSPYTTVIDVSILDPIDYDELPKIDTRVVFD